MAASGHSLEYAYLPWGRHLNYDEQPVDKGIVTVRLIGSPKRFTDIGAGAQRTRLTADVHVFWEDDEDLGDTALFMEAVEDAVVNALRGVETSLGTAIAAKAVNSVDLSDTIEDAHGSSVLRCYLVVTVQATYHEVYG